MVVIVTGSSGHLGTAVCDLLLAHGHSVIGVDVRIRHDAPHPFLAADLGDPMAIHRALDMVPDGADAVVHLANHITSTGKPAGQILRENLSMNTSVFMAAYERGVGHVVFSSSIQAMLGGSEIDGSWSQRLPLRLPLDESIPCAPTNVYGLSKVLSEQMLDHLTNAERFGAASHRSGPESAHMSAVTIRFPFIVSDERLDDARTTARSIGGEKGVAEAFTYITRSDAADAVCRAVEATVTGHEILWCSAPDPRTEEGADHSIDRFYVDVPGAQQCRQTGSLVDCSKAHAVIGWRAVHTLHPHSEREDVR